MRRRRPWESSDHRSDRPRRGRRFQFQDGTDGAAQHSSKQRPIQLQPQQNRVGSDHELGCVLCRAVRPERVSGSSPSSTASQPSQQPPPPHQEAPGTGRRRQRLVSPSRRPAAVKKGLIWRGRRAQRRTRPKPSITCRKDQADGDHPRPGRSPSPSKSAAPLPACLPATASTCASSPPAPTTAGPRAPPRRRIGIGRWPANHNRRGGARGTGVEEHLSPGPGLGDWARGLLNNHSRGGVLQFACRLAATPRPVDHHRHPAGSVPSTPQRNCVPPSAFY